MRASTQRLRRVSRSFAAWQTIGIFVVVALVLTVACLRGYGAASQIATSTLERAGVVRMRDAQLALSAILSRQGRSPDNGAMMAPVERVLEPYDDGIVIERANFGAMMHGWRAVQQRPHDAELMADFATIASEYVAKISDASRLTYDDDVRLFNFGDAYAAQAPIALERIARAVALATANPSTVRSEANRDAIDLLVTQASVNWAVAESDYETAVALRGFDTTPLRRAHDSASAALSHVVHRLHAVAPDASVDVPATTGALDALQTSMVRYLGALDVAIDTLLLRRLMIERATIVLAALVAIFSILFGCALVAFGYRRRSLRDRRILQSERDRADALANELARRHAERQNVFNHAQFRTIFDGSPMGIATIDSAGNVIERNTVMTAMFGDTFDLFDDLFDAATFARVLLRQIPPAQIERQVRSKAGSRWIDLTVSPIEIVGGEAIAAIVMIADVTVRKSLSEKLHYDATHDSLTGLYSRDAFVAGLTYALETEESDESARHAVMLVDLDRFKFVNDTLGHAAGDDVLVIVAKRLAEIVRPVDILARLHGDAFALLVTAIDDAHVTRVAERVLRTLRVPIVALGQPIFIDASVGICVGQARSYGPEELLRHADTAMYRAKRSGRGRYAYFDAAMHEASGKHMRLASEMLGGLERGEFRVAYQPIVTLADARIEGFEALLRWNHPEFGEVSPVDFIAIAEETGAIEHLGRFVLREACHQTARWDRDVRARGRMMSINLSVRQLVEGIVEDVEASLAAAGISGDRLVLEITESALLESDPKMFDILSRLRRSGARLCLDDFGTGYSSLRYLQQFPVDMLKIDRSFVFGASGGLASEPIVRMLLNLAESLGLGVIAEGVETAEQSEALFALGCELGQGFRFAPARAPDQIDFSGPLAPTGPRLEAERLQTVGRDEHRPVRYER